MSAPNGVNLDNELQKATAALQTLESLLTSDVADDGVLTEFRDAVNRIRITGWMVKRVASEEAGVTLSELLAQEHVRCVTRMAEQLSDFLSRTDNTDMEGMETLLDTLEELAAGVRVYLMKCRTAAMER